MTPIVANIFGFGNPVEIAIIAGVVVLLFGGAKIAGFGKNLGEGMKEFKKAVRETQEDEPTAPPPALEVTKPAEPVAVAAKSTATEETAKEP
ncbi:MAG TPA: twin-arginine translocase TatA/TatE family subunit [Capsulimonadaceae bacterium]|nr:twin-arginine translocase TatA/TatE family subunit [Capsulimonadaceae bacterium]